jgi:hypothetical protein
MLDHLSGGLGFSWRQRGSLGTSEKIPQSLRRLAIKSVYFL